METNKKILLEGESPTLTDAGTPWFLYVNVTDVTPELFDGVANYLLERLIEFEGNIIHLACDK